jgi:hypothetical protein
MKRTTAVVLFTLPLVACMPSSAPRSLYSGPPGATYQTFAEARHQCGAQVPSGTGDIVCSAFQACLASRGYSRSPTGEFDVTDAGTQLGDLLANVCGRTTYQ